MKDDMKHSFLRLRGKVGMGAKKAMRNDELTMESDPES